MNSATAIAEALTQGKSQLAQHSDSADLDAQLLLCKILAKPRSFLFSHPETPLSSDQYAAFKALLEQRQSGRPVAQLLGTQEFWSMELVVTADTLIPRPETELLVEQTLRLIAGLKAPTILDLGTGTGAIALALAKESPQAIILAVDQSDAALIVAQQNRDQHALPSVEFLKSDWFSSVPRQKFDVIVSNPPYIAEGDPHLTQSIKFEPESALIAGPDGLKDIRKIAERAGAYLKNGGHLLIEHGYDQAGRVQDIFAHCGFGDLNTYRDLQHIPRVTHGIWRTHDER